MKVMVIAAHPDDEVLGCGGTIYKHDRMGDDVHLLFIADGETSRTIKGRWNRNIQALRASQILGAKPPVFCDWSDQLLDTLPLLQITQRIEQEVQKIGPQIVYTHHAGDLNLDHRLVHQATLTALRPLPGGWKPDIFGFEVLSSTEWGTGFFPSHFVDITGLPSAKKDAALREYEIEMRPFPHPRSHVAVAALATIRGATVGFPRAEAFTTIRTIR